MTLSAGTKLGPYEILAPIGAGGMGEVYRAKDTRLDRIVAIKVLSTHLSENPDHRKRFEQEARVISSLNHPHICALYDIGHQDNIEYLVMEYLEGETLRTRLKDGGLTPRKAIELGTQIAGALGVAHEKGIVHRDLKPENIFLTAGDQVKILDFGLAHSTQKAPESDVSLSPTRTQMTSPGTIMGTVGYMSPEQVRGLSVDPRSDIFAFGSLMYEMLTGRRAFHGDTPADTMTAILKEDPADMNVSGKNIPPALDRIIRRCMEKRPESRFRTAEDLAFALEMSTTSTSASHSQPLIAEKSQRRWIPYLLGLLLLGALIAGGFWISRNQKEPTPISFRQLTFKRGNVMSARFAPDGQTVIYGAAFGGKPVELFSVRTDGIESRSMGLSADILGISKSGEMAILLNRRYAGSWITVGTLAKVSLSGGAPREILENVNDGDISEDGENFAIVRQIKTSQRLEYPIGKVLFETHGWLSHPRISPDGKRIAFLEHPVYGDDRGYVALYDESGKTSRISPEFSSQVGLAWLPSGEEVLFSGAPAGGDAVLYSTKPGRKIRLVYRAPSECHIEDVSATGKSLLTSGERRVELAGLLAEETQEKNLTSYGDEEIGGISADARVIAATQTVAGGSDYQVYFRRSDASEAVMLGAGSTVGISPNGKWVLSNLPSGANHFINLYPVGPGESRKIRLGEASWDSGGDRLALSWTSDGNQTTFIGYEKGQDLRGYLLDISKDAFRPVTPFGVDSVLLSPDGRSVIGVKEDVATIYSISGGQAQVVLGWESSDSLVQWENTGKAIFVWDSSFPAKLYRLDLTTGKRELWKEMAPPDPIGVAYGRLLMTPDGKHYLYRYRRILNRLNVAEGLK